MINTLIVGSLLVGMGLCVILIGFIIWGLIRNEQVYRFRRKIIDLDYDYAMKQINKGIYHRDRFSYYDKLPSGHEMVFSTKPLKLTSYFTNEELTELFSE